MDSDRLSGSAKKAFGQAESAVGNAVGDANTEAAGMARQAQGAAQNVFGQAKDAVRGIGQSASKLAGDAINSGRGIAGDGGYAVSDAVSQGIQNRPGSALLAVGLFGFALGVILTRGAQPSRPRRVWDRY